MYILSVCTCHKQFKSLAAPTILVEQGINHIERYGTQYFRLCSLCFYVVQHKICQSTKVCSTVHVTDTSQQLF